MIHFTKYLFCYLNNEEEYYVNIMLLQLKYKGIKLISLKINIKKLISCIDV